jgi:hypothetical protein
MRTVIGLLGLGIVAGVIPTGLVGIAQAAQVLLGTAGALVILLVCCVAGPPAARRAASAPRPTAVPRQQPGPIVSPERSI